MACSTTCYPVFISALSAGPWTDDRSPFTCDPTPGYGSGTFPWSDTASTAFGPKGLSGSGFTGPNMPAFTFNGCDGSGNEVWTFIASGWEGCTNPTFSDTKTKSPTSNSITFNIGSGTITITFGRCGGAQSSGTSGRPPRRRITSVPIAGGGVYTPITPNPVSWRIAPLRGPRVVIPQPPNFIQPVIPDCSDPDSGIHMPIPLLSATEVIPLSPHSFTTSRVTLNHPRHRLNSPLSVNRQVYTFNPGISAIRVTEGQGSYFPSLSTSFLLTKSLYPGTSSLCVAEKRVKYDLGPSWRLTRYSDISGADEQDMRSFLNLYSIIRNNTDIYQTSGAPFSEFIGMIELDQGAAFPITLEPYYLAYCNHVLPDGLVALSSMQTDYWIASYSGGLTARYLATLA